MTAGQVGMLAAVVLVAGAAAVWLALPKAIGWLLAPDDRHTTEDA